MSTYVKNLAIAVLCLVALALWGVLRDKDARIAEAEAAATVAKNPAEENSDMEALVAQMQAREFFLRRAFSDGSSIEISASEFVGSVDMSRSSTGSRQPVPPSALRPCRSPRWILGLGLTVPEAWSENEGGSRGWTALGAVRILRTEGLDVGVFATLRTGSVVPSRLEVLAPALGVYVSR